MRVRLAQAVAPALLALLAIALVNAFFMAASFYAGSAPSAKKVDAVREAFATGELVEKDYLKSDWRRGKNQYNDCVVLQLAINPRESAMKKALAPALYVSRGLHSEVCRSLRLLVSNETASVGLIGDSYSRYWHGYVPLTSALLEIAEVGKIRQALRLFVFASLLALILAAARAGGALRTAGISVGVTGMLFWGLPYYGQGLSFAPGDAIVILGITAFIIARRTLQNVSKLVVYSAAYGSLVAYFDFLTGPLPTGACLLFLFAYLAKFDERPQAKPSGAWKNAILALGTYTLGAVLTVAIKQLLVLATLGPDELRTLVENAQLYTGFAEDRPLAMVYVSAFFNLFKYTPLLTYYSILGGVVLLLCFALAWAVAAYLALRSGSQTGKSVFLAHVVGASGIMMWVLLMPTHTIIHGFMARMLMVPFALGWSALALLVLSAGPRVLKR